MTDRCQILMRRIPVQLGDPVEAHATIQRCGAPIETDGMCRFHARQREIDKADERRLWREQLGKVGRA